LAVAQYVDGYKLDTGPVQNAQTGTTFTFALSDTTKTVTANNSAASAYTIPPQSAVVWEDYTTLRLLNLGAGVVTLTAGAGVTINGTATVAQYSSATLIRTASNTWTITGASSAPGRVLLKTELPSAASSVIFNDVFSATYKQYEIAWAITGTATTELLARMRVSGTDESGSIYRSQIMYGNNSSISATRLAAQTAMAIGQIRTTRTGSLVTMTSPYEAIVTSSVCSQADFAGGTVTDISTEVMAGVLNNTTSYTGITIFPGSGTITGKISIFGIKE
jgi:hypothetical protein